MMGDVLLVVLGLLAGLVVAAYWVVRARMAEADLRDARARNKRLRAERDAARAKAARLAATLDGEDVRAYWPEPLGGIRG